MATALFRQPAIDLRVLLTVAREDIHPREKHPTRRPADRWNQRTLAPFSQPKNAGLKLTAATTRATRRALLRAAATVALPTVS